MSEASQMAGQSADQPFVVSDESLVKRMRAGESAAGDELVRRHSRSLMGYLYHLAGSVSAAEEIHQQTWLSVLEHIDRFDERASSGGFKAWLFRIATNKLNDQWRSQARRRKAEPWLRRVKEEVAQESMADVSEPVVRKEDAAELRAALERLPEAQRQVVCMRYYADMKFADIAAVLGCPLNTALGRMHKALLKLREVVER